MRLFKINGVIQNYAWGGKKFIPELIGEPISDQNCAEYWMGAHDKSPAILKETGRPLNEVISEHPEEVLGEQTFQQFGRLPFLFKVLDVADMLSIQVHPTKKEAEKGFARENELGIPLTAPHRNYKDDNHKPEIMVALGEFWLLHGFKSSSLLLKTLQETPELSHLVSTFETGGYKGLYKKVMQEPSKDTSGTLRPLIDRILPDYEEGKLQKSEPEFWAARAYLTFCDEETIDKGLYSIFFLNILKAEEGEAVFQAAGVPHAYLEGHNMELMANSDNVLRGGLTTKHVDVKELMQHVFFEETIPEILKGDLNPDGLERIYKSPAPDFELSKIELEQGETYLGQSESMEISILLTGEVRATSDESSLILKRGEVFAVSANTRYQITSIDNAQLYKARCPLS